MLNKAILVSKYADQKQSIPQIAREFGLPLSRVRTALIKEGVILRTRAEGVRLRSEYLSNLRRGKTRLFTAEWRENIAKARTAWGEKNAKGTTVKPSGYICHTRGKNKDRGLHTTNMELIIERRLRPHEVVHHIDEDRANNHPDNLALMTRAGHARHHRMIERLKKCQDH